MVLRSLFAVEEYVISALGVNPLFQISLMLTLTEPICSLLGRNFDPALGLCTSEPTNDNYRWTDAAEKSLREDSISRAFLSGTRYDLGYPFFRTLAHHSPVVLDADPVDSLLGYLNGQYENGDFAELFIHSTKPFICRLFGAAFDGETGQCVPLRAIGIDSSAYQVSPLAFGVFEDLVDEASIIDEGQWAAKIAFVHNGVSASNAGFFDP